jgi:hypothetical protein
MRTYTLVREGGQPAAEPDHDSGVAADEHLRPHVAGDVLRVRHRMPGPPPDRAGVRQRWHMLLG